jgi:hypothetical protein
MIQPIIEKSYLVELSLGTVAVQKQINFSFIPQLEGTQIYGIQSFSQSNLLTSPNGSAVVTNAGLTNLTVTFVVGDVQEVFLLPVADLNSPLIYGFVRMFNNKRLNLTKSFVTIQSVTNVNNNESVLFNFIYR